MRALPVDSIARPRLPEWLRIQLPTSDTFGRTRSLLGELKPAHRLRKRQVPQPLGVLEQGHGHLHDRRRPLHAGLRLLRGQHRQTVGPGCRRTAARGRGRPADGAAHVVITAVARDDVADGGADHFRQPSMPCAKLNPGIVIEVLTPDFLDKDASIDLVLGARPQIFNHNLETVRRLTPDVRHRATYDRSLSVLRKVKERAGAAFTPNRA